MYKVFFNDRIVLLTDDFIRNFQVRYGLFFKYSGVEDLRELLDFYWKLKRIDTLFVFHHDLDELRERFKACFNEIYAGGGLVRNADGRYLIIRRHGKWDLPKGKVNKNETIIDAAHREVTEETGLSGIETGNPLISTYHAYDLDDHRILKRTSWFEMTYRGREEPVPAFEEDITEIRWVKKEDLPAYTSNCFPAIIDVLKYANLL